jgi:hypothetical protein
MPGDYFALAWDLLMLLVILYLCIALPYTVAFAIDFVSTELLAGAILVWACLPFLKGPKNCRRAAEVASTPCGRTPV